MVRRDLHLVRCLDTLVHAHTALTDCARVRVCVCVCRNARVPRVRVSVDESVNEYHLRERLDELLRHFRLNVRSIIGTREIGAECTYRIELGPFDGLHVVDLQRESAYHKLLHVCSPRICVVCDLRTLFPCMNSMVSTRDDVSGHTMRGTTMSRRVLKLRAHCSALRASCTKSNEQSVTVNFSS